MKAAGTPNKKKTGPGAGVGGGVGGSGGGGIRRATGIKRKPSFRTGGLQYAAPLGHEVERERMYAAEREQSRVDKFWGLDLQTANINRECMLMSFEDSFSRSYQVYCANLEKQSKWKEEFNRQQYQAAYDSAVREQENRKRYMGLLFSAPNSDVILSYRWNSGSMNEELSLLIDTANAPLMDPSLLLSSTSASSLTLPPPDIGARNISLHLDGIQQVLYGCIFIEHWCWVIMSVIIL
jgi:hypothetical protein